MAVIVMARLVARLVTRLIAWATGSVVIAVKIVARVLFRLVRSVGVVEARFVASGLTRIRHVQKKYWVCDLIVFTERMCSLRSMGAACPFYIPQLHTYVIGLWWLCLKSAVHVTLMTTSTVQKRRLDNERLCNAYVVVIVTSTSHLLEVLTLSTFRASIYSATTNHKLQ
jgi:hypothetical protein